MIVLIKSYFRLVVLFILTLTMYACGGNAGNVQTAAPAAAVNAAGVSNDSSGNPTYRLGVGDTVNIVVFGESELTMDIELNDTGKVAYPFLGELVFLGKTLDEVQTMLTEGLSDGFLVDPKVSVTMDTFREVYIGGEVVQGGNFPYQPGLTVGKAIVLARGFTDRASRTRIFVVSEGADSSKPVRVSTDYVLKPGDVITVQRRFF